MKRHAVAEALAGLSATRRDGEALTVGELRELLTAQSLFGGAEAVVLSHLSLNSDVWAAVPEVAADSDTTLMLLETKPDKRTKTYKWLQKHATVVENTNFTERQTPQLATWCVERTATYGAQLTTQQAMRLIERLGRDQLRLDMVLQQVALADEVNDDLIDQLVPLPKTESVFLLLQAALAGNGRRVSEIVAYLEAESGVDGAYQTLGLLASQVTQLSALVLSGGDVARVAADFGAHPFVLQQLAAQMKKLSACDVARIVTTLSEADRQMKTTNVAPWLLLEIALVKIKI